MRNWKTILIWLVAIAVGTGSIAAACKSTPTVGGADDVEPASKPEASDEEREENPERIILFIGDGMGLPYVAASSYAGKEKLAMLGMPEFGMMTTHEYEYMTTDSAASATAMATGQKTHFGGISVRPGTEMEQEKDGQNQLRTLVEAAREADWKTGLVSTVRINHATPGSFAAHRHERHQYEDIALDISEAEVDVLFGGGYDFFRQREDDRDLLEEMEAQGSAVVRSGDEVRRLSGEVERLVGLMHGRDMPWAAEGTREMELEEMVVDAIEVLDRADSEGYFLMVEGAKIDWAGHAMDGPAAVSETADLDNGVRRALEYARDRSDTLVVVTADHETGGLDVIDGPTADRYLEVLGGHEEAKAQTIPEAIDEERRSQLAGPFDEVENAGGGEFWPSEVDDGRLMTSFGFLSAASRAYWDGEGRFSASHTPVIVPVFAEGIRAQEVAGIRDNADLGRQLMAFIDGDEADVQTVTNMTARAEDEVPKNVVLLIGEGLGMGSLSATYYGFGVPAMFEMERAAAVATHGDDRLVNDSAASSTALATGSRTRGGALGMVPGEVGGELAAATTVVEQASESGRRTGLVTTGSVVDAVPAAFFAKQNNADDPEAIAEQFLDLYTAGGDTTGFDFVAGGGAEYFGVEDRQDLEERGYAIHDDWSETPAGAGALYLSDEVGREAGLAQMTSRALKAVDGGDSGFFLLVHSGRIADAKRAMDRGDRLMAGLQEFDQTVAKSLEFGTADEQTLVVATSDVDHGLSVLDNHYGFHADRCGAASDCGGDFDLLWHDVAADEIRHGQGLMEQELQGEYSPPQIALQYPWLAQQAAESAEIKGPRTANFAPLFAHGPGAKDFGGFMDQPDVGRWLVGWARGGADEPRSAQ